MVGAADLRGLFPTLTILGLLVSLVGTSQPPKPQGSVPVSQVLACLEDQTPEQALFCFGPSLNTTGVSSMGIHLTFPFAPGLFQCLHKGVCVWGDFLVLPQENKEIPVRVQNKVDPVSTGSCSSPIAELFEWKGNVSRIMFKKKKSLTLHRSQPRSSLGSFFITETRKLESFFIPQ